MNETGVAWIEEVTFSETLCIRNGEPAYQDPITTTISITFDLMKQILDKIKQ